MAKDRAAPFSRKHRRYWIPVTGGMIAIGILNVTLGVCTYEKAGDTEPIRLTIPGAPADAMPGLIGVSEIPADVMRAFAVKYPQTIPAGALVEAGNYAVLFPPGRPLTRAVFKLDGTFVSEH